MSRCTVITSSRRFRPPRPTEPGIRSITEFSSPTDPGSTRTTEKLCLCIGRLFQARLGETAAPPVRARFPLAVIRECDQLLNCFGVSVHCLLCKFATGRIEVLRVVLRNIIRTSATGSHLDELLLRLCVAFPRFGSLLWCVKFCREGCRWSELPGLSPGPPSTSLSTSLKLPLHKSRTRVS